MDEWQSETLTVYATTSDGIDPKVIIGLLTNITGAFDEFSLRFPEDVRPNLKVIKISTGSLIIDLVPTFIQDGVSVAKFVGEFYTARSILAGFLTHLSEIDVRMMHSKHYIENFGKGLKLFRDIAVMVIRGQVSQVSINVLGSNKPIVIDTAAAQAIHGPPFSELPAIKTRIEDVFDPVKQSPEVDDVVETEFTEIEKGKTPDLYMLKIKPGEKHRVREIWLPNETPASQDQVDAIATNDGIWRAHLKRALPDTAIPVIAGHEFLPKDSEVAHVKGQPIYLANGTPVGFQVFRTR